MRRIVVVAATAALFIGVPQAHAQDRWVLELRTGPAFPTDEPPGVELQTGFGFEAVAAYRVHQHVFAYAGWDWHHFASNAAFGTEDPDLEETGYVFGARFEHPLSDESARGLAVRLHAGGTYNHIELEDPEGEGIADSGHGLGWEAGASIVIPVGSAWRLVPGLRYRALSRDLVIGEESVAVDMRYLAAELGVAWGIH